MKQFTFKAAKTLQAIRWILNKEKDGSANIRRLCAAFFLADHEVLNIQGRPIFGDRYFAMEHGPVPEGIYKMIEGWANESIMEELAEKDLIRGKSLPWKKRGTDVMLTERIEGEMDPDVHCDFIAPAELKIICEGWETTPISVNAANWLAKGKQAWLAGRERPGHLMAYEDMLDGDDWDV